MGFLASFPTLVFGLFQLCIILIFQQLARLDIILVVHQSFLLLLKLFVELSHGGQVLEICFFVIVMAYFRKGRL